MGDLARIDRQQRQHRAQLDHHLKGLSRAFEAKEMARQQQVAGGRDRDELGQSFKNPQEKGDQRRVLHLRGVLCGIKLGGTLGLHSSHGKRPYICCTRFFPTSNR